MRYAQGDHPKVAVVPLAWILAMLWSFTVADGGELDNGEISVILGDRPSTPIQSPTWSRQGDAYLRLRGRGCRETGCPKPWFHKTCPDFAGKHATANCSSRGERISSYPKDSFCHSLSSCFATAACCVYTAGCQTPAINLYPSNGSRAGEVRGA